MNTFQWIEFGLRVVFVYGPKLWSLIKEIMEELHKDRAKEDLQKIATFRRQVTSVWSEKKGKLPEESQIQVAFLDGCRSVKA